jgi:hypothetical protein
MESSHRSTERTYLSVIFGVDTCNHVLVGIMLDMVSRMFARYMCSFDNVSRSDDPVLTAVYSNGSVNIRAARNPPPFVFRNQASKVDIPLVFRP